MMVFMITHIQSSICTVVSTAGLRHEGMNSLGSILCYRVSEVSLSWGKRHLRVGVEHLRSRRSTGSRRDNTDHRFPGSQRLRLT